MKMTKNYLLVTIALLFTSPSFAELGIKSDVIYGHKDGMALVYSVLQPENANGAPLPGALTRSGAQKTVSLGHSVRRLNC